jgi:hypothetical protein
MVTVVNGTEEIIPKNVGALTNFCCVTEPADTIIVPGM